MGDDFEIGELIPPLRTMPYGSIEICQDVFLKINLKD